MSTDTDTGRVAVITGASSGIGAATARAMVAAAQRVEHELGRTDVLINNAGVMLLAPFTSDQGVEQLSAATAITADDIAQIIAFAVSRAHSVSLNEVLVRPTAQAL